jgi:hypothetical protein
VCVILSRNNILCPLLTGLLLLVLTGCDKEDQYLEQIDLQQSTINELQMTLTENKQQIEQLTKDLEEKSLPRSNLDDVTQEYPWLNKLNPNTKWDKVVIHRYDNDPAMTIVDPLFLESINVLLNLRSVGTVNYPSGYQSDIDTYTYELYEGEQIYTIKVVDRGVIEAGRNELYFEVDEDISQLGAAFMPKRSFIKHDGLIAKMAASGAVKRGEEYVQLSAFRVQSRISPLIEGKFLKNKPVDIGKITEKYTFYYYGIELVMDVYKDHVYLSGDGSEEWYLFKDADVLLNGEPG